MSILSIPEANTGDTAPPTHPGFSSTIFPVLPSSPPFHLWISGWDHRAGTAHTKNDKKDPTMFSGREVLLPEALVEGS